MTRSARKSLLLPVAIAIFAIGLVALAAIFVLFAGGRHDLPLWLNSAAGTLIPLGLALALIGLVREARAGRRTGNADSASRAGN